VTLGHRIRILLLVHPNPAAAQQGQDRLGDAGDQQVQVGQCGHGQTEKAGAAEEIQDVDTIQHQGVEVNIEVQG
jgi:hypothetical protein